METSELYDFVIVGGGMIGSSAAKHAAKICSEKNINARIALIGVAEEGKICTHREQHFSLIISRSTWIEFVWRLEWWGQNHKVCQKTIFTLNNSSKTMSRLLDKSDCWRNLAEKSLLRYEMIEYESGIKFYNECGFLSLIDDKVSSNRLGKRD